MNLSVDIGKLKLKNPVTVASGTFGYAEEFADLLDLKSLGAIVTKTITLKSREGNAMPRIIETSAGILNAIGLQNEGLDNFLKVKLPLLKLLGTKIIVSISAENAADFILMAGKLENAGVEAIELNLSCPNIEYSMDNNSPQSGTGQKIKIFAQDCEAVFSLIKALRKKTNLVLIAKLSPNVTDISAIARSAEDAGADALSLVNTFLGMAVDIENCCPKLANITGGLSGPAIKPLALRMVYETARVVSIPVIGMGGIINAADALEFIIAGAAAVGIGTANFVNPKVSLEIIKGLEDYLQRKNFADINQIRGTLKI
ncbi:MAG: dihydroorotate dehydrogenase [Candidatus Omnitrophota bacterium]|nr:MAG: dihydroorotate dehydrogenase [Candidatus Omnitrophota bacterium]